MKVENGCGFVLEKAENGFVMRKLDNDYGRDRTCWVFKNLADLKAHFVEFVEEALKTGEKLKTPPR